MMGLDRYIFRQILGSMAFVTLAVTAAIYLSQSLRLIDLTVNRGVSFAMFLYMTVLLLPNFLVIILPVALFSAIAFVQDADDTDGMDVTNLPLGPAFPHGVLVTHDASPTPSRHLLTPFERVAASLKLTMDSTWDPRCSPYGTCAGSTPKPVVAPTSAREGLAR